jgi:RNA polymerase sigma-70 factor (ECF subfamily)
MNQKEIQLVQQAQKGNVTAFEALIKQHDKRVLQLAQHMLGNLPDAQDVYQETMLRAFQNIATFGFQSQFSTWLFKIAINQCLNIYRKRRIQKWLFIKSEENSFDEYVSKDHSTDHQVLSKEFMHQLGHAMNRLSPKQRAVFTLKHHYGYKISEIAEMMNSADGTIKNDLFRATQKLKTALRPYVKTTG